MSELLVELVILNKYIKYFGHVRFVLYYTLVHCKWGRGISIKLHSQKYKTMQMFSYGCKKCDRFCALQHKFQRVNLQKKTTYQGENVVRNNLENSDWRMHWSPQHHYLHIEGKDQSLCTPVQIHLIQKIWGMWFEWWIHKSIKLFYICIPILSETDHIR